MRVAIIGGTGAMGRGLAKRLSGENTILIGSRDERRAREAARGVEGATGLGYEEASRSAEIVIFSIPYSAIGEAAPLADALRGKVAVSTINPLRKEGGLMRFALDEGSAAEELAGLLPRSHVAAAFNNVSPLFFAGQEVVPMDILVAADTRDTFEAVARLVTSIPNLRPLYAGPLTEARTIERMTPLILNLAKLNGTWSLTTRFPSTKDVVG